jgi:hypothetical protein
MNAESTLTYSLETLTIGADDNGEAIITRLTHGDDIGGKLSIKGGSATGTSKVGGNLELYGGRSTGNAEGGSIVLYSSLKSSNGAHSDTARDLIEIAKFESPGILTLTSHRDEGTNLVLNNTSGNWGQAGDQVIKFQDDGTTKWSIGNEAQPSGTSLANSFVIEYGNGSLGTNPAIEFVPEASGTARTEIHGGLVVRNGTRGAGYIQLYEDADSVNDHWYKILCPTLSYGDVTLTLPDWTDSSVNDGYVLTTDGNQHATLSWSAPASGGASALNDLSDVTYSNGDLGIAGLDTLKFGNGGNANVSVLATAEDVAGKALTITAGTTTAGTTNNIAGGDITIQGGQGKGSGAGGNIIFQVAPEGSSGSTLNSYISPLTISSAGITTATSLILNNTTNDASASLLKFNKSRGEDGQDNDDIGDIQFWSYDDGTPSVQQYAGILAEITDATSGEEKGSLSFRVAEYDGTLTEGLSIKGQNTDGDINITVGGKLIVGVNGATAGDVTINNTNNGEIIWEGSTADGNENILRAADGAGINELPLGTGTLLSTNNVFDSISTTSSDDVASLTAVKAAYDHANTGVTHSATNHAPANAEANPTISDSTSTTSSSQVASLTAVKAAYDH